MNQIKANFAHACSNFHVSVPVALGAAFAIAIIWLPHYAPQLAATASVLGGYGIIAASNTPPHKQNPAEDGDSSDGYGH